MTINTTRSHISLQTSMIWQVSFKRPLCLLQLKNAESILEYERMAEISFEKRDFRMVSVFLIAPLAAAGLIYR